MVNNPIILQIEENSSIILRYFEGGREVWIKKTFELYEDNKLVTNIYFNSGKVETTEINISIVNRITINKYIEEIYKAKEDVHHNGCDGEEYKIILTPTNKPMFETKNGYIYGTKYLQPLCHFIIKITNAVDYPSI